MNKQKDDNVNVAIDQMMRSTFKTATKNLSAKEKDDFKQSLKTLMNTAEEINKE